MVAPLRLRLRSLSVNRTNLTGPGSPVYQAVERAAAAAVDLVKEATPVRTGNLKDDWAYRIVNTPTRVIAEIYVKGPQGRVSPGEKAAPSQYVRFVVFGTSGPIRSMPPNKVMKISDGLGPMFQVTVAGQAANDFPRRALKKIRKQDFEQ